MDRTCVHDIMHRSVVTIGVGQRMSTAQDIMMLGGVRHMPVVSAGHLVGVLSERDVLRAAPSSLCDEAGDERRAFLDTVEVARVMSSPAIVIDPKAGVHEAARMMARHKIGCLPVLDDAGRLVGLITETDLMRHLAGGAMDGENARALEP